MYKATQTRIQTYLNDVAGVRIVCAFIDDNRLDEQIRQAVLSLETKWTEKEIGFQVELEEVKYTANEGLFMHIWINLLDNAIKFSPSKGTIYVRFTLAVNEYNVKRNEKIATFVEIVAFDKKAIILAHNVGKGSRLAVEGKLRTSNYISETGEKKYKVDIILSEFTFIDSKKKVVNEGINEEVPF